MNNRNKIKIAVNGKLLTINTKFSLKKLTEKLKTPINKVAIELNEEIVDKKKLSKIILNHKDKIEIVHFIGGG
jgi:thiamine biosynthesis protein ThiS